MDTALFPCVIESLRDPNYGLCACYELDEATSTRKGEIFTFHVGDDSESSLNVIDSVRLDAGVLDCKYLGHTLYAALSTEKLNVYQVDAGNYRLSESHSTSKPGEGLFLSVSASTCSENKTNRVIGVSTQQGSVIVYKEGEDGLHEHFFVSEAHKLAGEAVPAWIVAIYPRSTNVLLTGGDDCKFRLWDTRSGESPTTTKSFHDAGVTTAQWHPVYEHVCAVGSYDESVSVWDIRSLRSPLLHHSTGGGVWRAKWLVHGDSHYLATASMQGGSNVFEVSFTGEPMSLQGAEVVNTVHFTDNSDKHLSYGIDFLRCEDHRSENAQCSHRLQIASCSFYDRRLSLWSASFEKSL